MPVQEGVKLEEMKFKPAVKNPFNVKKTSKFSWMAIYTKEEDSMQAEIDEAVPVTPLVNSSDDVEKRVFELEDDKFLLIHDEWFSSAERGNDFCFDPFLYWH